MMEKIPNSWAVEPLEDVVHHTKGKKPKILSPIPKKGFVPYIDIKAFEFGSIRQYADIESSKLTNNKDILVVWDGARSGLAGHGQRGAIGSTIMALTPISIHSKYLFRFLQSQYDYINSNPRGTGIPHVDPNIFWKIKLPIAPLQEQNRIAVKLEKLLAKVETCRERLKNIPAILKRFRHSVLSAACSGELTKDWRNHNPDIKFASELLIQNRLERKKKYEEECLTAKANGKRKPAPLRSNDHPVNTQELDEIPETWCWDRLVNIASIRGGVTKGRKFGSRKTLMIPYLRVANVQDGYLDLREIKEIRALPEDLEKYRLENGDILYTEGGDRDKLGRGTVWKNNINNCIHQNHIFRARLYYSKISPEYISLATKSDYAKRYFFENASQTVNLASINMTNLGNVPLSIPPEKEQIEIVHRVESLFKIADQIEVRYQKAKGHVENLTQSILAKAFRGELVPQDPNDLPASELLKQIKAEREKQQNELKPQKNPKRKAKRKNKKKT